jgi:hypothetical protein
MKMTLTELGARMQQWHSSQWDPIYMVASLYVDNQPYPDTFVVHAARRNLQHDLSSVKEDLRQDLREIIAALDEILREEEPATVDGA